MPESRERKMLVRLAKHLGMTVRKAPGCQEWRLFAGGSTPTYRGSFDLCRAWLDGYYAGKQRAEVDEILRQQGGTFRLEDDHA